MRRKRASGGHAAHPRVSIRLLQTPASAAAEPNLACHGCPTADTRVQVSDTTASPLNSVGMLVREKQHPLSKCALRFTHFHMPNVCAASGMKASVRFCFAVSWRSARAR